MRPLLILFSLLLSSVAAATDYSQPITGVKTEKKVVALTFDDGPRLDVTHKLLKLLKANEAKATFYHIGKNMLKAPELAPHVVNAGHELGNHSQTHAELPTLAYDQQLTEIEQAQLLMQQAGHNPRTFRAPYLKMNQDTHSILADMHLLPVHSNISARDAKAHQDPVIIARNIDTLKPGAIILAHERPHTLKALETLLPKWRQQGWRFVTVSELLNMGDIQYASQQPLPSKTNNKGINQAEPHTAQQQAM